MDKMLFIAMNGAKQTMQAQTSISHNLANTSTLGFKASLDTYNTWHVEGPVITPEFIIVMIARVLISVQAVLHLLDAILISQSMVKAGLRYRHPMVLKHIPVQVIYASVLMDC